VNADPNAYPLKHAPETAREHLHRIKIDTYVGMGFSNLIALFIIITTAATLHAAGITEITTSAQAAEALRPLAGDATFLLFSLGIIGTGMLAVPGARGFGRLRDGGDVRVEERPRSRAAEAREFYAIHRAATLGGVAVDFTPIDPIKALSGAP